MQAAAILGEGVSGMVSKLHLLAGLQAGKENRHGSSGGGSGSSGRNSDESSIDCSNFGGARLAWSAYFTCWLDCKLERASDTAAAAAAVVVELVVTAVAAAVFGHLIAAAATPDGCSKL